LSAIDCLIRPRERDLGGFSVRRVLPAGRGIAHSERTKQDWKLGRFAAVPGKTEFIPQPES